MNKHSAEYDRYLKSDAWAQRREERLQLDGNACVMCGRKNGVRKDGAPILQVHHIHYSNLGHERLEDLCSVCPRCHQLLHKYYRRFRSWEDRKSQEGKMLSSSPCLDT